MGENHRYPRYQRHVASRPMHYRHRFVFHPVPDLVERTPVNALRRRVRVFDAAVPQGLHDVASGAVMSLALMGEDGSATKRSWIASHVNLLTEFFDFRRRAQRGLDMAVNAPEGACTALLAHAWHDDHPHTVDEHLYALEALWLDSGPMVSDDHHLSFGIKSAARRLFLARHYAIASLRYAELAACGREAAALDRVLAYALRGTDAAYRAQLLVVDDTSSLSAHARRASAARYSNDPKQKAKTELYELWRGWQSGTGDGKARYRSNADFARKALVAYGDVLTSTATIERWQREWAKGEVTPEME